MLEEVIHLGWALKIDSLGLCPPCSVPNLGLSVASCTLLLPPPCCHDFPTLTACIPPKCEAEQEAFVRYLTIAQSEVTSAGCKGEEISNNKPWLLLGIIECELWCLYWRRIPYRVCLSVCLLLAVLLAFTNLQVYEGEAAIPRGSALRLFPVLCLLMYLGPGDQNRL